MEYMIIFLSLATLFLYLAFIYLYSVYRDLYSLLLNYVIKEEVGDYES